MFLISHSIAGIARTRNNKKGKPMTQQKFEVRDGYCSSQLGPIPGLSERGLDGEVRETGENLQTFKVKIELDTTDVEKTISQVNKQVGDFLKILKVDEPVYRVTYFRKTGGHVLGFQAEEEIKPSGGFFHSKATPDLKGQVLVRVEEVSHIVCEPYDPKDKD
ncbi:hypothetical protein [Klebsiella aerogenes]|uniref:hypothetical protein n=1 Tax=Klebsiella aerogenes TaxID=548 RepID=UPI0027EA2D68|nr:hypothetical protein [Klebsiella aerogenes]